MRIFAFLTTHEKYMHRCLQLARLGAGHTAPNPMVGAVLVHNERVIGEGYHQQYGQAHAEVNCINSVSEADSSLIAQSTLYVSLEPCAHYGKTPPCADLIIKNNIPEVVIGCRDSYTEVDGKGIQKLQHAGIQVTVGVLEKEAQELNKRFFTFHQKHRPWIILKWAQTADGKIAGSDDKRLLISNEFTNLLVHQWRSEEAAIMIGTNTALKDDPSLTTRLHPGNDPLRIVIDMELKLPQHLHVFDRTVQTIVFNSIKQEEGAGLSFYKIDNTTSILPAILSVLQQQKILSVIVEGGATLLQSFIKEGLWDEARVITNTELEAGAGIDAPVLDHHQLLTAENMVNDTIHYFINNQQ
ncbi:bifunctional diaminohydroxyphosphoribosylaminopyrimidine deaminase/5-amino-6-(5-phosphoribosylamino)uracil reductase RibD [Ferruginibacter sp.]